MSTNIKTWQEHTIAKLRPGIGAQLSEKELAIIGTDGMLAEIADLRAALADEKAALAEACLRTEKFKKLAIASQPPEVAVLAQRMGGGDIAAGRFKFIDGAWREMPRGVCEGTTILYHADGWPRQERTGNHNVRFGSTKHMLAEIADLRAALASKPVNLYLSNGQIDAIAIKEKMDGDYESNPRLYWRSFAHAIMEAIREGV